MKVKKKLLTMLVALCLLVGMIPFSVSAQSALVWPVPGHTAINRNNGDNGFHNGNAIDITDANIYGADVVAAMGGTVTNIWLKDCHHNDQASADACCNGFGTGIVIQGDDGRIYQYAHMLPGSVPSNVYRTAYVTAGQKIGQVGSSGFSTGPHLHFGISLGNYWNQSGIDPSKENYIYDTTPVPVSLSWSDERCEYDTVNAFFYAKANVNVSGSFTEAGFTLWDDSGKVVASKSENPGHTGSGLEIWYNVTDETGVVLKEATNYKYQIYTVFNGKRYETAVKNFRTKGQETNSWTQELDIKDWTYGEPANAPTAAAAYGTPEFTYSTEENGAYTYDVPKNAGTYYVKATVAGNDQYTGLEAVKEFHINKAIPQYELPENLTYTYGQTLNFNVLPAWLNWKDGTQTVGDVGEKTFLAYYNNFDSNYEVIDDIEVPVIVVPADITEGIDLSKIDENTDLDEFRITFGTEVLVQGVDYKFVIETSGNQVTVTLEFMGNFTGSKQTTYTLSEHNNGQGGTSGNENGNANNNNENSGTDKSKNNTSGGKAPKTGDDFSLILWAALAVVAGGATVVAKKRTEK